MSKRRARRAIQRGREKRKKLEGLDPTLLAAMQEGLGKPPTVADAKEMQMAMMTKVLQRMVEMRIAQWMEACLYVLKDEFGFKENDLARFAREFKERLDGQEAQASDDGR